MSLEIAYPVRLTQHAGKWFKANGYDTLTHVAFDHEHISESDKVLIPCMGRWVDIYFAESVDTAPTCVICVAVWLGRTTRSG